MKDAIDNEKTKGILTLLIKEIQDILEYYEANPSDGFRELHTLLKHWIEPNDLHPERVKSLPKEYGNRIIAGDKSVWKEIMNLIS